jgi:hypothetical protein
MSLSLLPYIGRFEPQNGRVHLFSPITYHAFCPIKRKSIHYLSPQILILENSNEETPGDILHPSYMEPSSQEVQWNYFPFQDSHVLEEEYKSPPNSPENDSSWISSLIYGYKWWTRTK